MSTRAILGSGDHPAIFAEVEAGGSIPSLLTFIARPGQLVWRVEILGVPLLLNVLKFLE
jgi:hypothetical protein